MDIRFLDEKDREEIEGINDISKKEIITNSNSNKDEIITNINNSKSAVIGSSDKAKNEIIKSIDGVKQEDMFTNGLYKQEIISARKHSVTGKLEPLLISINGNVESKDIVFDGMEKIISGFGPVTLINHKLFEKIYQPNLKIPTVYLVNNTQAEMSEDHIIDTFSRVVVVDDFSSLPSRIYGKSLYIIKNFEIEGFEGSTNDSGYNARVCWYCEYLLK